MKIKKGFTLVELMVTITIAGILGLIAVPSMVKWNKKDKFINQTREIIDTINDARAAALSDKKCPTSNESSVAWGIRLTEESKEINLMCYHGSSKETVKILQLDNNVKIDNNGYYYIKSNDPTYNGTLFDLISKTIDITFSAEKERAKIWISNLNPIPSVYDINKIQLTFEFSEDVNEKRTICFDRIAGFPTISKDSNCAE